MTLTLTQPHLPSFVNVMTYHDLATQLNQTSYLSQILMDLHQIFSICPQWANRYEVTLNLTQPHLPTFVMTYHDLAT